MSKGTHLLFLHQFVGNPSFILTRTFAASTLHNSSSPNFPVSKFSTMPCLSLELFCAAVCRRPGAWGIGDGDTGRQKKKGHGQGGLSHYLDTSEASHQAGNPSATVFQTINESQLSVRIAKLKKAGPPPRTL